MEEMPILIIVLETVSQVEGTKQVEDCQKTGRRCR